MLSIRFWFVFSLAIAALLGLPSVSRGQDKQGQGQTAGELGRERSIQPPAVAAGKAVITYEGGQLMIKAQSAPLIDVLRTACSQIGAELDAPSEPDEPILGVFGPGPSREVLAAMMEGSHFNLAMAGSTDDPNALVRIVVLPKSADSADKTNRADVPAQDSIAQSQSMDQPTSQSTQPSLGSALTVSYVESRISQMRELFAQAQTELAQIGGVANLDMDLLLKEAETQIKATAAIEADPDATPIPFAASSINRPNGRSRHRH
jgi:hypothetical protein